MADEKELILITGVSGRIGAALAERAAEQYRVVGFNRSSSECPEGALECLKLDVTSGESVHSTLEQVTSGHGTRIASVVHLAAFYDFSGEDSPLYQEVNVQGTERLLRELQRFELGQFLFASTMLVHPPCRPGDQITEDWPLEPSWAYPQSKAAAEARIREARGDVPVVLARICNTYDEWGRHPLLAHQIQRIYERQWKSHLFPGNPMHGMTYLHREDLVDALLRAIDRRTQLPPETPLILGEPEPVSYQLIQDRAGELLHGSGTATVSIPAPVAQAGAWVEEKLGLGDDWIKPWMIPMADEHYAFNINRAKHLLGWEPARCLRDSLPDITANLARDPVRWYKENELKLPETLHGKQAA